MTARPVALALLLAVGAFADPVAAQASRARETLREGVEAAARGDTTRALALLDQAIAADPALAEAYFHRGRIYAQLASARPTEVQERMRAQAALEAALRQDPENPRYLLELGRLMLKQQIRLDAGRIFERALKAAARADAATLAEVHYELGILHETQWLRFTYRHMLPFFTPQVDGYRAVEDAGYVWDLLEASAYPGDGQGAADRDAMLEHFRAALTADPAHAGAASHLLAYLYDRGQLEEYLAVARRFVAAASSQPLAYLALGLGLHRSAREDEAAGAFEYALSLMQEPERRTFENIGRILTEQHQQAFDSLAGPGQSEFQRRFWAAGDPLFLTPANEYWLEYMARMAYADIRFGVAEYGLRGWETDRGIIHLRYGEPVKKATFSGSSNDVGDMEARGKVTTVWSYGPDGPVFLFRQNPGYRRAIFGNDFRFYAEDLRSVHPAALAAPAIAARHPVPIQVARFRGDGGRVDLEVHALLPLDALAQASRLRTAQLETGLFVQDAAAVEIERRVGAESLDTENAQAEPRSWRTALPAGKRYLVGVEARDPASGHAAVGRQPVEPKRFPAGELAVSDLLLAHAVEPLTDDPVTRSDFRVRPNAAMTYSPDQAVALYFEVYNLLPDEDHYAAYELDLVVKVEEIERGGPLLAQILGELADKWGFTPEGADAARLRFSRQERVLARDAVPEFFRIEIPDAPAGRYSLRLTVRDLHGKREVVTEREFRVRD